MFFEYPKGFGEVQAPQNTLIKAYPKLANGSFAIKVEILVLHFFYRALAKSKFLAYSILQQRVLPLLLFHGQQRSKEAWEFNVWLCHFFIAGQLRMFISYNPHLANQVVDLLEIIQGNFCEICCRFLHPSFVISDCLVCCWVVFLTFLSCEACITNVCQFDQFPTLWNTVSSFLIINNSQNEMVYLL